MNVNKKNNYFSLVEELLPAEVSDKILDRLFNEVRKNREKVMEELDYVLYSSRQDKIQQYFDDIFIVKIPLTISCVEDLQDLNEIIYTFKPGEPRKIYCDMTDITNTITGWQLEEEDLMEIDLDYEEIHCSCCGKEKLPSISKGQLIENLITGFLMVWEYLQEENDLKEFHFDHHFLEIIELNIRNDGKLIIDYFNGS